ncbi:hypothetical protein [Falcatimonas sp. MSJ-15]|nr:hypothetical protein [Falcatimonas sp. MSJ-15]
MMTILETKVVEAVVENTGYKSNDAPYWRLRLLKQLQRTRL